MPVFTKKDVETALPANLRTSATQDFVDDLNAALSDPVLAEHVRENFLTYSTVLMEGKWSAEQYASACTYVTHKLMGRSNLESYALTFPQRHADLVAKGTSSKDISAYVSAYHKTKLVSLIMERSLMPVWVTHSDVYYKALAVQSDLMMNAQSEKVRSDAANSVLTHLTKPKESVNNTLNVVMGNQNNVELNSMKDMMAKLAQQTLNAIDQGMTAQEVAGMKLIEAEYDDVPD